MSDVTPEMRFERILTSDMCIGCGLCQALLGADKIRVVKDATGALRPRIEAALCDADVDLVYQTCPAVRCEAIPEDEAASAPIFDPVWGPFQQIVLGWAQEPEVRFEGSTAGVLTGLGRYLIASDEVNFVLHVGASKTEPTFGAAKISRTAAEVLEGAGSRYGPTAPLLEFDKVLGLGEPFAVIAKPCDLNALRNLAKIDPRVDQLVRYMLAPVCGGFMPDPAMSRFLSEQKIVRDTIRTMRYRGRGCPGPTTFNLEDGETRDFHYLDFWGEDESSWSLPNRCKFCPDGIGDAADIAAADTWPGASPDRASAAIDPGVNSILARTRAGAALLSRAVEAEFICLDKPVAPDYLSQTQPHQVAKKRAMKARYNGMKKAGHVDPNTRGLRLQALHDENPASENQRQEEGAYRRVCGKVKCGQSS